ncbi:hypothetical protein [Sinorhizobium terangae]|uniref:Lipoprotein n=1 Tax=Sinorhizobium terangae TaxID=110322 RepID=A0A6N7L9D6_SINTE|nr:hypothetical protein [Sinorhizobium terangae]MBB4188042.1 hypothetical protein [Sinorhizobium terangae]MQX14421.1 hypothetical protein [Sinorhizobium terangae]WFU49499.1 hypothetical protein QA637_08935 [Sinorhizobium terangae]
MRISRTLLITLCLSALASSCTETAEAPAPARRSKIAAAVVDNSPRLCKTPQTQCYYGTGPAGEPCSCWSNEGAPAHGITTK